MLSHPSRVTGCLCFIEIRRHEEMEEAEGGACWEELKIFKFWDFKISLWHLKGVSGKLESSSAVQTKRLWFKLPRWWAQLVSLVVVSDMPAGESRPQGANLIKARNYISRLKQLENAEHPAGHCQFNPDQKAMPLGGFCNWILYLVEENNQNGGAKFGKHWIEESFLNIDTGLLTGLQ